LLHEVVNTALFVNESLFNYQWRQGSPAAGAATTVIAGATSPSLTPTQAQSNRRLTVTVTFVDAAGSPESRTSAITTVVGDLFPGAGNSNVGINLLAGTAGQDDYHGGASNDNLSTGAEADRVSGDAGDDTVSTGSQTDTITYSGAANFATRVSITNAGGGSTLITIAGQGTIGLAGVSVVNVTRADFWVG
jgi:Ca2+-binding RTX toxin-like protein